MATAAPTGPADHGLTDEQRDFVAAVRDYSVREITPDRLAALTDDGNDPHNHEVAAKMGELGWYGLTIPERYGGSGGSFLDATLFLEESARGQIPVGAYGVTLICVGALNKFGSERQKAELLGHVAKGGTLAIAMSEPDAGSDVSGIRTRAVYDEAKDEWVLNGVKTWITNGGIADVHVVVAVVDPALKGRGHASFIVPPGTPGLRQGQKFSKHGIRASHTAEVILDDVRVPGRCLLGGKDKLDERLARVREGKHANAQAAMQTFEATRPSVGAQAIGIARAAYEYSLEYAMERVQFGRPIIQNQSIAFMLADMATEIDAARMLVWRAAWLGKQRKYQHAEGSMAKLKAGRVAVWSTERAMQILGGYGYVKDYPVERWHRDAKIYDIFEGTEQIQQLVISRAISGMRIE
jgi:alkylation response protein AidB-like acyl-CoA dehydrogenase